MEIRKVPVGQLFQRMPKIVNDVAITTGKKISTIISGVDLRVDKTILEKLEAPLIHMVRNATDHGIEQPEIRSKYNKYEEGTITLSAEEIGGIVQIKISDDGAGLNLPALRKKAISLGIITDSEPFDQEKIISTMFRSGVATSEVVSDISGSEDGMDAVKQNPDVAGRELVTTTEKNCGTTFTLQIHTVATAQSIHGFVLRTESEPYIITLNFVEVTISARGVKIENVNTKGHVLRFKNEVLSMERQSDRVNQTTKT